MVGERSVEVVDFPKDPLAANIQRAKIVLAMRVVISIEAVDGESVSEKTQQQVTEACSRSPVMCACEPNGFDSVFLEKVLSAVT